MADALNFSLGDVSFYDWEIPEDFGPLGGKQVIHRHEFPGGQITQTAFGNFPEPITFKGYLTGPNALSRQQQIDAIRSAGEDVTLTYGGYSWTGKVSQFQARAKHQFLVPYELTFLPSADLSGTGGQPIDDFTSDGVLSDESSGLSTVADGTSGLDLPDSLTTPVANLQSALQTALLNGDGTVAGIQPSDATNVQNAAQAVQDAAAPLIAGSDATQAAPAIAAAAWASTIATTVANAPSSAVILNAVINPNFFLLAAQYLGDATLWQEITNASGLSPDPQPIGQFQVTIPAP